MTLTLPLPKSLEQGLARLKTLQSINIGNEIQFNDKDRKWVIPFIVVINQGNIFVPPKTSWYILITGPYPWGNIDVCPAVDGGIKKTFPHQAYNQIIDNDVVWRSGKLCLDAPLHDTRGVTEDRDPLGNTDERLLWYMKRTILWINLARTGQLLAEGHPFETPCYPSYDHGKDRVGLVVHDEVFSDFELWQGHIGSYGLSDIETLSELEKVLAVITFRDKKGRIIRRWNGRIGEKQTLVKYGFWWLWPTPIVIPPWHVPETWGDLRIVGKSMNIQVDQVLRYISSNLRGKNEDSLLLLGYPIPKYVDSIPQEIHWNAVYLPRIPSAKGKPPRGFRANDLGWWIRDKQNSLANHQKIHYINTENWHPSRLQARGRLPDFLRDSHIAIIGLGSLGSILAESLVRAGHINISLIDNESLVAGNICRHVATFSDIGQDKTKVMARRLCQISPFVKVEEHTIKLPSSADDLIPLLDSMDVIIDCTGSDEVVKILGLGWWPIPRLFISFSVGFAARRMFSFGSFGNRFPVDEFHLLLKPWIIDDTSRWEAHGEHIEGAGCWSPLFPARYDDIIMASSVCIKELETMKERLKKGCRLQVYERFDSEEGFESYKKIMVP